MRLYNTLTKRKEEFAPLAPGEIKMYVCGPTVYNYIHIGNARPFVIFDAARRYFEYKGYNVTFAQNFTDVDDKIIARAAQEGVGVDDITRKYIEEFYKDVDGLNIKRATHYPRVTEEMSAIVEMIETLAQKGFAYESGGAVYFDTAAFEGYGKLSGKDPEGLLAGARVALDDAKRSPADFALWKPAKPGEPRWPSPWSEGRPGWHIECSVMAKKYLGDTIDIHAGGEDLIFPHHENEIAQSECANGKPFAKYWLHNGMINVDNRKMSKSEGNFFTVRDISERFRYDVIRFFILGGHYKMPLNFSAEGLKAAESALGRVRNCAAELKLAALSGGAGLSGNEETALAEADKYRLAFEAAMDDDLNTANAITAIFECVTFAYAAAAKKPSKPFAEGLLALLELMCGALGVKTEAEASPELAEEIEAMLAERAEARKNKDWETSDRIRGELEAKGVAVKDTAAGARWFYKG